MTRRRGNRLGFMSGSERQEDKYYELMIGACESIAESPEAGRKYHEISEEIPGFKTGKHSIFYRELRPKEIEVVRILHASMDLKSKMGE